VNLSLKNCILYKSRSLQVDLMPHFNKHRISCHFFINPSILSMSLLDGKSGHILRPILQRLLLVVTIPSTKKCSIANDGSTTKIMYRVFSITRAIEKPSFQYWSSGLTWSTTHGTDVKKKNGAGKI
jgi:hypothetical protein